MQLCDVCKKEPVRIRVTGKGDYCLKCHNDMLLKRFGIEDTFQYADTMTVLEPSGEMHTFRVEHIVRGPIVSWDAYEQGGEYHFREISDIKENGGAVAKRFFEKIVNGVCTKSLEDHQPLASNLLYKYDRCLGLKEKGTINVITDEDQGLKTSFEIDGMKFSGEDLESLFGCYPNFTIQYKVQDKSLDVLKEDEYLVPVRITKSSLVDELHRAINICTDRGFLSYKDVPVFDEAVYPILDKLEILMDAGKRDLALEAGKEILSMIIGVETDDDYFPVYMLRNIVDTIDPFGIDEGVAALMQEWEDSL